MNNQQTKTQVVERLKQSNNVLVTVSNNPSVDQLAGAIGLTLLLNKLGKHATTVFSGTVPSTIEFLKPDETIEKTTDSLRDFIIALDKSKADKLRYKVEDKLVKIFITPYRTTISDKDLEFSQGDFNIDVVIALGVHKQQDLDQAITVHGRILHDAAVIAVNNTPNGEIGTINWVEAGASSLCEMLVDVGENLGGNIFDAQMATAFLTGIVAETKRFSNEKATPNAMAMASRLATAGASPQLIAAQLEPPPPPEPQQPPEPTIGPKPDKPDSPEPKKPTPRKSESSDGALKVDHNPSPTTALARPAEEVQSEDHLAKIHIDPEGTMRNEEDLTQASSVPTLMTEPPTLGEHPLTANTSPEPLSPSTDALSLLVNKTPLLEHDGAMAVSTGANQTLDSIEKSVASPHQGGGEPLESARNAVTDAINQAPLGNQPLEPIKALNAQPIDLNSPPKIIPHAQPPLPSPGLKLPPNLVPPAQPQDATAAPNGSTPPPPVPPPLMPPVL